MSPVRFAAVLLVFGQLAGCAALNFPEEPLPAPQHGEWRAPDRPDEPAAPPAEVAPAPAGRDRTAYERQLIARADELIKQGRWGDAAELYRSALHQLPDSTALRQAQAQLDRRRALEQRQLQLELLIVQAEALARTLALSEKLAALAADETAVQALAQQRDQARAVGAELGRRGTLALREDDLATARRTLPLALRLHPSPGVEAANTALNETIARSEQQARRTQAQAADRRRSREIERLQGAFAQAYQGGDVASARQLLDKLLAAQGSDAELESLREQLDQMIATKVAHFLQQGIDEYSQGRHVYAIASWHKALELDPDNLQVQAHIARAERVLEKLQELRDKQTERH